MDAVVTVLHRVKEYVRSPFVRLEIAHLLQNIETLRKVFLRMVGVLSTNFSSFSLESAVLSKRMQDGKFQ